MSKAKKKEGGVSLAMQLPPVPEHLLVRHPKRWVSIHFKLMGFSALDGEIRLPPDVTVRMLEAKIIAHHGGSIGRLTLWRDRIEPSCVIRDLSLSLRDLFMLDDASPRSIPGVPTPPGTKPGEEDHQVIVYYDYRPHDTDCPLLLRPPTYPAPYNVETLSDTRK